MSPKVFVEKRYNVRRRVGMCVVNTTHTQHGSKYGGSRLRCTTDCDQNGKRESERTHHHW